MKMIAILFLSLLFVMPLNADPARNLRRPGLTQVGQACKLLMNNVPLSDLTLLREELDRLLIERQQAEAMNLTNLNTDFWGNLSTEVLQWLQDHLKTTPPTTLLGTRVSSISDAKVKTILQDRGYVHIGDIAFKDLTHPTEKESLRRLDLATFSRFTTISDFYFYGLKRLSLISRVGTTKQNFVIKVLARAGFDTALNTAVRPVSFKPHSLLDTLLEDASLARAHHTDPAIVDGPLTTAFDLGWLSKDEKQSYDKIVTWLERELAAKPRVADLLEMSHERFFSDPNISMTDVRVIEGLLLHLRLKLADAVPSAEAGP